MRIRCSWPPRPPGSMLGGVSAARGSGTGPGPIAQPCGIERASTLIGKTRLHACGELSRSAREWHSSRLF